MTFSSCIVEGYMFFGMEQWFVATNWRHKIQNGGAHFRIIWFSKIFFSHFGKKNSDFVLVVRKKF